MGGRAIGLGRGAAGFTSTGWRSWRGVTLPSYDGPAFGTTVGLALGLALTLGWSVGLGLASLAVLKLRSPRNQRKPSPQTTTSSTPKVAIRNFSRTGKR